MCFGRHIKFIIWSVMYLFHGGRARGWGGGSGGGVFVCLCVLTVEDGDGGIFFSFSFFTSCIANACTQ
jgi:hypothetical protein